MMTAETVREVYADVASAVRSNTNSDNKSYARASKRNQWFGPRSWRHYYAENYILPIILGTLFAAIAGWGIGAGGYFLKQGTGNRYSAESKIINTADGKKATEDSATAARAKLSPLEQ